MDSRDHKFYYAPISTLDHKSAVSEFNNFTLQPEFRFRVKLWNDQVQKAVTSWIQREINSTAKFIQVIPFDNIILTSSSSAALSRLQFSNNWIHYQQQQNVEFTLNCFKMEDCDYLAQQMRNSPRQFKDLRIAFRVASERSQKRETNIRIENVLSGELGAKLQQRMPQADFVLLKAEDKKTLLTESATNIIIETLDDTNSVASHSAQNEVYSKLEDLLVSSRITIKSQSDELWDSVFWNEDNYRPDKIAKSLNDVYKKSDEEDRKKLIGSFSNTNKFALGAEVSVPAVVDVKAKLDTDFSRSGDSSSESFHRLLQEMKDNVQWDGEKFEPKPLQLSRINLGRLRDTQSFRDKNVQVKYSTAVLSLTLNIEQESTNSSFDPLVKMQCELEGTYFTHSSFSRIH